jgi:hypothetical protein
LKQFLEVLKRLSWRLPPDEDNARSSTMPLQFVEEIADNVQLASVAQLVVDILANC